MDMLQAQRVRVRGLQLAAALRGTRSRMLHQSIGQAPNTILCWVAISNAVCTISQPAMLSLHESGSLAEHGCWRCRPPEGKLISGETHFMSHLLPSVRPSGVTALEPL